MLVGATGFEPVQESEDKPGHYGIPWEIAGIKASVKKIFEQGHSGPSSGQPGTENKYQIRIKKIAELIEIISRLTDEEMDDLIQIGGNLGIKRNVC